MKINLEKVERIVIMDSDNKEKVIKGDPVEIGLSNEGTLTIVYK